MTENRVVALRQKGAIDDPLTEILRTGARRLIAQAVEAEFETFLASTAELVLPDGRRRVVRHGHDRVRAIQTGIGPVEVQKPKARDRAAASGERIRFTSNILPKWARPPIPECPKIENLVSFYNEHVDLYVDGVLQDRPTTPFS